MVEVETTYEMLQNADVAARNLGELRNSITNGDGNLAGFVGKYMVASYLGRPLTKTPDFDILYDGQRIEVKTKRCSSKPRSYYECSIAEYNPHQRCDYYVFVRVLNDMSRGWILGAMRPDEYFQRCKVKEAGQRDYDNDFRFHCKSYNLPIESLHPLHGLLGRETKENGAKMIAGLDRWIA